MSAIVFDQILKENKLINFQSVSALVGTNIQINSLIKLL